MFLKTFEITNNHINRLLKSQGLPGVGSSNYVRKTLLTPQVKEIIHDVVEQMPKFNIHYSDTSKEAENVVYLAPTTTIQGVFEEVGRKLDILIEEDERKPNYGTFSMYIKKAFPNVKTKALSTDKCNVCDDVTMTIEEKELHVRQQKDVMR